MTLNASISAMRAANASGGLDAFASGRVLPVDSVPSSLCGSKSPLFVGTRFSEAKHQDHIGAVKRIALDANDIKFHFSTLIIDDNDKIDKDLLQK